ncbi:uncharacterized protein BCR38DRAFT_357294 [Pseudomassariella vexata]|uniref:Uncharacterized protein n=1 Tax=Pseudomassariella vexata TaxID=1141098 RepID=A0A1Y2D7E1_9PEZI|nr:uncharacterized protein BCR38DRAFT_357294 [Pseudomassariella vexata]ORY55084.1 hypothetical protein BCR38DRAFT_357294 [Pseudomassariella vexata]
MSWDTKTAVRRRQNSSVSSSRASPQHNRQQSKQSTPIEPKSVHVADPFLQSFLAPAFDATDYLNSSLPPLQAHVSSITPSQEGAVPFAELSSQAQTLLSQLSAQTTRLTNTLTQLTDDILRSGSRLAYEVELLRGETLSLSEALADGLHGDIVKFVPNGVQDQMEGKANGVSAIDGILRRPSGVAASTSEDNSTPQDGTIEDPAYITQLRTLTLVRAKLDSVVHTFGDAMEFVFPPSELSVSSSFLSVSAPDAGSKEHSTEEKGQQVLKRYRDEISELLVKSKDPVDGIEKAARRIEELKELTKVWAGTAEEKGRTKFIDGLAKMVEDRHRDLMREVEQGDKRPEVGHMPRRSTEEAAENKPLSGYGIMSQLQKLRSGL